MRRIHIFTLITGAVLATASGLANAAARAELQPRGELAVDTPAQLVITVDERDAQPPRAPRLKNADVAYVGQMARTTIQNGAATVESSFIYTVVPRKPGPLVVPALRVGNDQTKPIETTVAAQPRTSGSRTTSQAPADDVRHAFVRLEAPKRTLYVGEAVPVKIRAYFRAGTAATLQGPPQLSSPAFTLSQLSKEPKQTQVEIDGVPHLQATWTAVLSPAKPTNDKVTIELPVEIAYRERRAVPRPSARDLFGSDPFGADPFADMDAFFDDPFAGFDEMFDPGQVRQRSMTLKSSVGRIRIDDVPAVGKPATYAGAIGSFEVGVVPPQGTLNVGEPATVTFEIRGTGNFDRVSLSGIPDAADGWKLYPGATNVELGADGVTGTKTFKQTVVPTRAGELEIPGVVFAYFDPKAKAYRTTSTDPLTVHVAPSVGGPDVAAGPAAPDVAGPRAGTGGMPAPLVPLIRQSSFWFIPGGIALATALLAFAGWSRRSPWIGHLAQRRRIDRRVARERARLDKAASSGDANEFFDAARNALQTRLAASWGVAPETITAADVRARLGSDGDVVRRVFEKADDIDYAPGLASPGALHRWRTLVHEQLANMEGAR